MRAHAHDEGEAEQQDDDGAEEPPGIALGRQQVVVFSRGDFRQESVVESEAAPRADVGEKQGGHAPFEVLRIEPEEPNAPGGPHVAEGLEEGQLAPQIVRHSGQQG